MTLLYQHLVRGVMDLNVIELEHLTRDYGCGKGIFDLSLNVKQGEVFGFLGPNGAGKTTTIRHLMGFIKAKSGKCMIDGMDCMKDRKAIQRKTGYLSGEISLFDEMTGDEYLSFVEKYRGEDSNKKKRDLIERFELDTSVKIRKMSKGMKQKTGIVAAFMSDPEILILDEPTSGLDPLMQQRFTSLINEEKKRQKTILMSSHIFEEVEKTCDRIGLIRGGRLSEVKNIEELRTQHSHKYTVFLESVEEAKKFAEDFKGEVDGKMVTVRKMQTLEKIFMNYYEEDENE
ncbi:ABC-2 type transport system ATP-binding protein [Lachnobacterium bovis DSM 14045]|uniref:ABC-2 type transport system ATP-binding protein n=2 Tax=Lachnobacterium bovis TaxID=140626 RepID=A0A1H3L2N3_9FIRM|nr:ABC-2 type transport system ATP-binding protein [Lachnobacterium bovis DSM 14045]